MTTLLVEQPLLTLFLALTVGTLIGAVRLGGVAAGPAGALFAGLIISALVPGVAGVVPDLVGTLGLTLFAFTIGLAGGPSFFAGIRRAAPMMTLAVAAVLVLAGIAHLVGGAIGLSTGDIAGVFAGSVTNTPALAAAVDAVGSPEPVVGYSLAYPFGVIGMILAMVAGLRWSRRSPTAEDRDPPQPAGYLTVRVDRDDLPPLAELEDYENATLVFSRVRRDGRETIPRSDLRLRDGDLLTVIGPEGTIAGFAATVGHVATDDLPLDRRQVDFRRVVLSNARYAGSTIAELDLGRFDAVAGFVRRGDVDLVARPALAVELGDRIRVVAPRDRLAEVVRELGDSERSVVVADPIGFSLGLLLGLAVGVMAIPLPGLTLQLGTAAGPLLVGLVLGRLGRTGPVVWQLPYATNQALRQFGVLVFLATVGLGAGPDLAGAIGSARGLQLLGFGALLTTLLAVALVLMGRALELGGARLAGVVAGAQGQPALLSFGVERTDGDDRVNLAYALLFPPTFVAKILAAQVLASL